MPWIPAAIGAVGALGSSAMSMFGGGGETSNEAAEFQADFGRNLAKKTRPLRNQWISELQSLLFGGYNPTQLPAYQPLYSNARLGMESQYGRGLDSLISSTPAGGGLTSAIAQLQSARGKDVGSLTNSISSGIIQDLLNKSYATAFQVPQNAVNSVGAASSAIAHGNSLNAMMQAQQNNSMSGLGQGLGSLIAMGMNGGGFGNLFGGGAGGTGVISPYAGGADGWLTGMGASGLGG